MKRGIILMNMGGPRNLEEVRVFLTNMFADPHILMMPALLRAILGKIIVTFRTKKAQAHYAKIGGKSPLFDITTLLAEKLQTYTGDKVYVQMRYTPPFSHDVIKQITQDDIEELILVPLYPHYSITTTASSIEEFQEELKKQNITIPIRLVAPFYNNEAFNSMIADNLVNAIESKRFREYDLVFSAHGLPQSVVDQGDPYQRHVRHQVYRLRKLLAERGIQFRKTHIAYQSKVGPMTWLTPSLEDKLAQIIIENDKILVYPIAFVIDNLESVFEIDIEYKEIADRFGFTEYKSVPLPNANDYFVRVLADLAANA